MTWAHYRFGCWHNLGLVKGALEGKIAIGTYDVFITHAWPGIRMYAIHRCVSHSQKMVCVSHRMGSELLDPASRAHFIGLKRDCLNCSNRSHYPQPSEQNPFQRSR